MTHSTKKLAIVISSLGPGGAERIAAMQASWFAEQGFQVSLITLDPSSKDHYDPQHANITRKRMQDNNPQSLYDYVAQQSFDLTIDHIHWHEEHYRFFELMGASKCRLAIVDHSTYFYPLYFQSHWPIFKKRVAAYKNADVISVLSRHSCQMFRQKLPSTVFIPNPLSYQSDAVSSVADSNSIIAVANWQRHEKRLDRVIEVFSIVRKQVKDVQLILAGPTRQAELTDLLERFRIPPDTVESVGQKTDVEPYYLRSRLLLHTSELEGFGLVLTEAGMHGLPRIAMDSPGVDEVIRHGVDGFLVDQGDLQAAAACCVALLHDDGLCRSMSAAARESVQQFALEKIGKRWNWLAELASGDLPAKQKHIAIAKDCNLQGVDDIDIKNIARDYDDQLLRLVALLQARDGLQNSGSAPINQLLESKPAKLLSRLSELMESRHLAGLVRQSGLFDEQWYKDQYPDVKASRMDAALHYVKFGAAEGRNPSGKFDTGHYLSTNADVNPKHINPVLHAISKPEKGGVVLDTKQPMTAVLNGNTKNTWVDEDLQWLSEFSSNRSLLILLEPNYLGIRQSANQFVSEQQMLFLSHDMSDSDIRYFASLIVEARPEKILVQGFPSAYVKLLPLLRQELPKTPIFCIYHGPFTQFRVQEERKCLQTLIEFQRAGVLSRIGLVKKGMAETLQTIGVDAAFVMNFMSKIPDQPSATQEVSIGIVGSEWQPLKPLFHQVAACKHIDYDTVKIVGSEGPVVEFCELFEIEATHMGALPQKDMPAFLAGNTINLYVSLSECAPMLPLESLSVGVPCLFGANNHYFYDHQYLRSRLMVDIPDSETRIARYARIAIEERQQIITEYREYAQSYNIRAMQSFETFLDITGLENPDNA